MSSDQSEAGVLAAPEAINSRILAPDGTDLGSRLSTWTIMFHSAVAERLGLNTTDHKALALLMQEGAMTAGELAELTGLTTGAITGVVDRLEQAGFVRRARDPGDRRKVVIEPVNDPERMHQVAMLFKPLADAMTELLSHYSEEELSVIRDYTVRVMDVMQEQTRRLRAETEALRRAEREG